MIITIDGPAAAGKGTLSKALADELNFALFDTGMIYRAVGLGMVLHGLNIDDENEVIKEAEKLTFAKMTSLSQNRDFRSDVGSRAASVVSAYPKVRAVLLKMQQDFAQNPVFANGEPASGVIFDGRDTGTVVCPNADVKFYITASTEIRAKRRYDEFVQKGIEADLEKVIAEMKARDERDSNRAVAPLKPADDAHILDTSLMSIDEVLEKALKIITERTKNP